MKREYVGVRDLEFGTTWFGSSTNTRKSSTRIRNRSVKTAHFEKRSYALTEISVSGISTRPWRMF
eukprot:4556565-Pleurochrysis_carterae.AAC.1